MASRAPIVDQRTGLLNMGPLENAGWDCSGRVGKEEAVKEWQVQTEEGGRETIRVRLRPHEGSAHVFVGDTWVGRTMRISSAEAIVRELQYHCK